MNYNDEVTVGLTEDDYIFGFYNFLKNLQNTGASLTITLDEEEGNMESLYNQLVFEQQIRYDTELYPD